jgi:type I restriction enzyme, S subunit
MKLGDLVLIRKGKKPGKIAATPGPGYQRLIQIDDLRPNAIAKFCPTVRDEQIAVPADVVIAWDGANAGTSSFGLTGVIGSTLAILRPKSGRVGTRYLGHFVQANRKYLRQHCKGATVPHIDGRILEELDIPLPPLAEQLRIAAILDMAEGLRAKRRATLAQLSTLTQSIFTDLFGDPAKNPKQWQRVELATLITAGPQNGLYRPASDYGTGTPILRIDGFYDGMVTGIATLKRVRISMSAISTVYTQGTSL